jgi:PIN domain nuclease of toxin-antitoxin system
MVNQIEPFYVVDTNALIWYLTGSKRLSRDAYAIFKAGEHGETRLIVSAIAIAEMYYSDQKFSLFQDFAAIYQQIRTKPYFRIVPFNGDDVLLFKRDAAVVEMHDRIIAGLARRLNAPLLTSDGQIAASGLVRIVW